MPTSAGTTAGPRESSAFRSLRVRNFRLFVVGQSISVTGTWMQNLAVGWLVRQISGSGVELGLVTAARYAPLLLVGPWGGLVADRLNKRRLLRVTAPLEGIVAAALGVLTLAHHIQPWSLMLLILAAGAVDVFDIPARQTFTNNMVGGERLPNAIALNSIVVNAARIVGPGAGGVVIAAIGLGPCFLINAASYCAVPTHAPGHPPGRAHRLTARSSGRSPDPARTRLRTKTPDLLGPLVLVAVSGRSHGSSR